MSESTNCCTGSIIPGLVDGHWVGSDSCSSSSSGGSNNGNVGGDIAGLQSQIDTLNGSVASLTTQVTTLAGQNTALTSSVTTLTATTGANTAAITTEQTTRATADSALSTSISTVSATTNTKNRTFIQSTTPAATAVGDLWIDTASGNKLRRWDGSSWVDTLVASGAIAAAVTTETTARTTADTALAASITSLTATVNSNTAAITSEATARASADTALAATISSLQAFVGTTNTVFVQTSAPTANAVNDLWLDSDDGLKPYYWNGTTWTDATDARLTGAIADITTEETARATADTALASSITSLTATVNGNVSAIATITSTYATQTYADTKKSEAITASNGYADGIVSTEATARAAADSAMAADITALQASTGITRATVFVQTSAPTANNANDIWLDSDNGFRPYYWTGSAWAEWTDSRLTGAIADITTEQSVRATADTALSTSISTLTSTVNGNSSAIATIQSTYATQTYADTKKSEAIAASNSYADGVVATEASARASADSAFTSSLSSLTATVGTKNRTFIASSAPTATATGDIWIDTANGNAFKRWNGASWVDTTIASGAIAAAVAVETSARATATGFLEGKYTLTVAAGNVVTGMNITSASGSGTTISDVTFQASSFKIKTTSTTAAPFTVTGDTVFMANATVSGTVDIGSGFNKTQITGSGLSACNGQIVLSDFGGTGGQARFGGVTSTRYAQFTVVSNLVASLAFYTSGTAYLSLDSSGVVTSSEVQVKTSVTGTAVGTLKDNGSGRFEISAQSSKSLAFTTGGSERWLVGSDGHLKSFGGDIRKTSDDGWGPKMFDGSNTLEFRWDGGLQVRVDGSSVFDVTTT